MPVMIGLLRGINLAGHHKIKMDELRALCKALKLRDTQTYIQSGNIVFRTDETDWVRLAKRIEDAIERKFGFRAGVVLRTRAEVKDLIARSPFGARKGLDPAKLTVTFLVCDLAKETCNQVLGLKADGEEIKLGRRELYVYFPDGMGRSKLTAVLDRTLKKAGTVRNWNTVMKLLEIAEEMEISEQAG
jgi:uncharacterized protein (DUF1697 family)